MAIKITLSADPVTGAGVNFNAGYRSFFDGFTPYELPLFLERTGQTETTQIAHLETPVTGAEGTTRAVLLGGQDFLYTFSNHTISGTINTVRLVRLGDTYDPSTDDLDLTNGLLTGTDPYITFSGMKIFNPVGVDGKAHKIVAGLMGGGLDGTMADERALTQQVMAQAHRVLGSSGDDRYSGTRFADTVAGNGGEDVLIAGAGADRLNGGAGADKLTGGVGADHFIFATASAANGDVITDFRHGQKDKINLVSIDAHAKAAGNQKFAFLGQAEFTGRAAQLRIEKSGGSVTVQGDVNGDGTADFSIVLAGASTAVASDFLL